MSYIKRFPRVIMDYIGGQRPDYDDVAVEDSLTLFVNDVRIATLVASPEQLKELTIGYLISEGVVASFDEIQRVDVDDEKREAYAVVSSFDQVELWQEVRSSGCIGVKWWTNEDVRVDSGATFEKKVLKKSLAFLDTQARRQTHGVHVAALFDATGKLLAQAVDVGRHSAVDKVIGTYAGNDFSHTFVLSSGRQPAGMVLKAARAGIPLILSKAAPISTGVEAALQAGVTLICFATGRQFATYSHPERLV
ncbi:MAG TPA: formate dehydrogenase accessory sulfurtransferase FdhD [Candidatus Bathyarchaeia archaeon]|nr:formate dehydrogenase accessory sulfurtransferase FdhD [Candidatus Bathyarchaeia archaeon]